MCFEQPRNRGEVVPLQLGRETGRARVVVPRLEKRVIRADFQDRTGYTTRIHGKTARPIPCHRPGVITAVISISAGKARVQGPPRESSDGRVALALNSPRACNTTRPAFVAI